MQKVTPHHYKLIIRDISNGKGEAFEVYTPAFNAHHFGDSIEKALKSYYLYFESEKRRRKKENLTMPKADIENKIKQVPLRIKEDIYENILSQAKQSGLSFNGFVCQYLEEITAK